ncbi:hypothetical protein OH77DRAFT_160246 [Trametes cingulata]|nr:hypothetical protein OH77DRAFT_160246 [Trametes cingulata]
MDNPGISESAYRLPCPVPGCKHSLRSRSAFTKHMRCQHGGWIAPRRVSLLDDEEGEDQLPGYPLAANQGFGDNALEGGVAPIPGPSAIPGVEGMAPPGMDPLGADASDPELRIGRATRSQSEGILREDSDGPLSDSEGGHNGPDSDSSSGPGVHSDLDSATTMSDEDSETADMPDLSELSDDEDEEYDAFDELYGDAVGDDRKDDDSDSESHEDDDDNDEDDDGDEDDEDEGQR